MKQQNREEKKKESLRYSVRPENVWLWEREKKFLCNGSSFVQFENE